MNTSRIHNPVINPAFYTSRSVPTAPLDPGTAEFVKGKPAITETLKDWRYYESTIIRNEEMNGALCLEYQSGGTWKEHYKTWEAACVPLGKSRRQIDRLIKAERDIRTECPDSDKAHTLEKVNNLPPVETPTQRMNRELAESMQDEKPRVVARAPVNGHKVKMGEVLENGESVMDYKRPIAPRTESGKPIHMMVIWNEVEGLYGKALNRLDEINRLSRHPVLHALTIEGTKKVMKDVSEWQEIAKKSHHA